MHPEVALARAGSDNLDLIRAARWRTRSIHSSTVEGLRCRGRGEGGRNLAKSSHSLDLPRGRVNDPQLPHPRRFSRLFSASFFRIIFVLPSRSLPHARIFIFYKKNLEAIKGNVEYIPTRVGCTLREMKCTRAINFLAALSSRIFVVF